MTPTQQAEDTATAMLRTRLHAMADRLDPDDRAELFRLAVGLLMVGAYLPLPVTEDGDHE